MFVQCWKHTKIGKTFSSIYKGAKIIENMKGIEILSNDFIYSYAFITAYTLCILEKTNR